MNCDGHMPLSCTTYHTPLISNQLSYVFIIYLRVANEMPGRNHHYLPYKFMREKMYSLENKIVIKKRQGNPQVFKSIMINSSSLLVIRGRFYCNIKNN